MKGLRSAPWLIVAVILVLIILAVAGIRLFYHMSGSTDTSSTWSSATISQTGPMNFTGFCEPCSYADLYSYSLSQEEQDVMMLKGLGVTQIRIDLGFDAWLANNQTAIQQDSSMIDFIKSQGLSLVIADASAERYRSFPLPWTQFKQAWANRVQTIAQLFQPSYYLVIKEPGWYVPMVSDARTNTQFQSSSDWLNLTSWLASEVQSVSPNTKIGISVCSNCISKTQSFYVPLLTQLPSSVSFVGFDTYGNDDNIAMQNFLNQYGADGKAIWNAETWSGAAYNTNSSSDQYWIISQYEFDLTNHVSEMMPFYSNDFVTYSTNHPQTFVASQPVATEFAKIISVS
jgi:hypothetical protein